MLKHAVVLPLEEKVITFLNIWLKKPCTLYECLFWLTSWAAF